MTLIKETSLESFNCGY